jgi:23S rRNA (cytosine1962-C5)-methyltransferase
LQGLRQVLHSRGVKNLLLRRGRGPTRQLEVLDGDLPSDRLCVTEHGMKLVVDLLHGQKTGLFLDHRESRFMTRTLCSRLKNPRVLNLFGYTGGFSIAAGLGGARQVVTVDLSKPALLLAEESWRANGLPQGVHTTFGGTVESYLEATPDASFEFVIADPPSFAPNEKAVENAKKAYKSMHASSLAKVTPGGYYLTASCSSHIHRSHFEETLREGAHRCKVSLQVLGRWAGGMDHPTPMGFSEGEYLTVVLARVWPVRS